MKTISMEDVRALCPEQFQEFESALQAENHSMERFASYMIWEHQIMHDPEPEFKLSDAAWQKVSEALRIRAIVVDFEFDRNEKLLFIIE